MEQSDFPGANHGAEKSHPALRTSGVLREIRFFTKRIRGREKIRAEKSANPFFNRCRGRCRARRRTPALRVNSDAPHCHGSCGKAGTIRASARGRVVRGAGTGHGICAPRLVPRTGRHMPRHALGRAAGRPSAAPPAAQRVSRCRRPLRGGLVRGVGSGRAAAEWQQSCGIDRSPAPPPLCVRKAGRLIRGSARVGVWRASGAPFRAVENRVPAGRTFTKAPTAASCRLAFRSSLQAATMQRSPEY